MQAHWFETFFRGLSMDLWRHAATPEQTVGEASLLERLLACGPQSTLLDVPCGVGRHSLELAVRGHKLTGLDISQAFIREAKANANVMGRQVDFVQGDMRHMLWESKFDGAFCLGNSIGYLEHHDLANFFTSLSKALKPGGRFLLESGMAAESILPNLKDREWFKLDDATLLIENRYHASNSCLETEYTFLQNGRTETRRSWHWVFTTSEIQRMLEHAELRTMEFYASLEGKPFKLGLPRLFLLGDKV